MIGTTYAKQRQAAMPTAAPVGPGMRDLGWLEVPVPPCGGGIASSTHAFTGNRSTRHLGRPST